MNNNYSDITLALAGICQAIDCVQSIAKNGHANKDDMDILFKAALKLDAENPEDIYSGSKNLETGFKSLASQLSGSKTDADFGRYLINIISLEKQFSNNSELMALMASRISQTNRLLEYKNNEFEEMLTDDAIAQLAGTYKDTISTLPTKIQVTGNSQHLEQINNQNLIRALLLSAIRSAVLWRQVGGKKRQFIFNKNKLVNCAKMQF